MIDSLSGILDERCIKLEMEARKKPEAIRELVDVVTGGGDIREPERLYQELLEREKLASTGIGNGIAIPHCLTDRVSETRMAFGRKQKGIKFDSVDRQPATLFFLIVGPEGTHTEHLQLLSKLSRYLHDTSVLRGLLEAKSPEDVLQTFRKRDAAR